MQTDHSLGLDTKAAPTRSSEVLSSNGCARSAVAVSACEHSEREDQKGVQLSQDASMSRPDSSTTTATSPS